jgi:hypothetical protein
MASGLIHLYFKFITIAKEPLRLDTSHCKLRWAFSIPATSIWSIYLLRNIQKMTATGKCGDYRMLTVLLKPLEYLTRAQIINAVDFRSVNTVNTGKKISLLSTQLLPSRLLRP